MTSPLALGPGCLKSLAAQSWRRFEIVVAAPRDEGPEPAPFDEAVPIRRLRVGDVGPGAARNAASRQARGEYLLFFDEAGVTLDPDCLSAMVGAARRTGADIVTCLSPPPPDWPARRMTAARRPYPVGGALDIGAIENCFGEKVLLVSARAFRNGSGFPADCEGDALDWAFLASAALAGARLEVAPARLYGASDRATRRIDAGDELRGRRAVMRAYADQPATLFARLLEPLTNLKAYNEERLGEAFDHADGERRELALRLSRHEPNERGAEKLFAEFCCAARMVDLAIDFALWNRAPLTPDTIAKAESAAVADALTLVGLRRTGLPRTIDLTESLRGNLRAAPPLGRRDLQGSAKNLVAHPIGLELQALQASAACPTGTRAVLARALIDPRAGSSARVAIAVVAPGGALELTEDGRAILTAGEWTGWIEPDGNGVAEPRIDLRTPNEDLSDLYLLSMPDRDSAAPDALVAWESVRITIGAGGDLARSSLQRRLQFSSVGREVLLAAEVLTDVSDFPFPVLKHGAGLMTHPVKGRTLLVRVKGALPAAASGVRAVISLEHKDARPVDFALWIGAPAAEPPDEAELMRSAAFSGWTTARSPFVRQFLTAGLDTPTTAPMDIVLAVRVADGGEAHFCHAHWHDLQIMTSRGSG